MHESDHLRELAFGARDRAIAVELPFDADVALDRVEELTLVIVLVPVEETDPIDDVVAVGIEEGEVATQRLGGK